MFKLKISDARGKEINIGDYVRYTGTGTIDKVSDFKTIDDNDWVKLEKVNLWYSHELLEVLDPKNIGDNNNEGEKEIDIEDIKNLKDDFENMNLDASGAEGGG